MALPPDWSALELLHHAGVCNGRGDVTTCVDCLQAAVSKAQPGSIAAAFNLGQIYRCGRPPVLPTPQLAKAFDCYLQVWRGGGGSNMQLCMQQLHLRSPSTAVSKILDTQPYPHA